MIGGGISLLGTDDFPGCPEVLEDGLTFRDNAVKKAVAVADHTGLMALADDSGLEVEALGGAPGVYSARYAGEGQPDAAHVDRLLRELAGRSPEERRARFVCVLALAAPDLSAAGEREVVTLVGTVAGRIGSEAKGANGFGYDPVFIPDQPAGQTRSFAEMTAVEKDAMSHRGQALAALAKYLGC